MANNQPSANGRGHKKTNMEIIVKQNRETVKQKMSDILLDVSWAKISEKYFGKSRSWLYHKMNGMNNGKPDDFDEAEKEVLRNALLDLSQRISRCANNIWRLADPRATSSGIFIHIEQKTALKLVFSPRKTRTFWTIYPIKTRAIRIGFTVDA